jgi:hypothetical protein
LFKKIVQYFIHHRDGQQHADGVATPVCVEVVIVIVAIYQEQNSGLNGLKNDIGEESWKSKVQLASYHEDKKGDLQHRTREPAHVHYSVHRVFPQSQEAYFSPGSPARFLSWPPYSSNIHLYLYRQVFPRHKGIGSLPSATNTICSVPIPGFLTGAKLLGIAEYIPANANAVSTISAVRFMGEFS